MDSIDITSSGFSLENAYDLNGGSEVVDNKMYIYIGIAILAVVISFLIYKFYVNKKKQVTFQDKLDECYDGVCHR
jgi:hypothetical protein